MSKIRDEDNPADLESRRRDQLADTWQMLLGIGHASVSAVKVPPARKASIGFTLVTGFLGAGKTTLLNSLLSQDHGIRLAVIVNDFGSVNVDAELVSRWDVNSIDLANGCVCCTLANGLVATLGELTMRDEPPTQILLEASGIAEPHGVLQVALTNSALRLDGVVCVVDADAAARTVADAAAGPVAEGQIRAADLVIVNKIDIASAEDLAAISHLLSRIAPAARRLPTTRCAIPAEVILGISNGSRFAAVEVSKLASDTFESHVLTAERPLDRRKICKLAAGFPAGVLRAKGFVRLEGGPERWSLLQVVGARWSLDDCDRSPDATNCSQLVVIGKKGEVDADALRGAFLGCQTEYV